MIPSRLTFITIFLIRELTVCIIHIVLSESRYLFEDMQIPCIMMVKSTILYWFKLSITCLIWGLGRALCVLLFMSGFQHIHASFVFHNIQNSQMTIICLQKERSHISWCRSDTLLIRDLAVCNVLKITFIHTCLHVIYVIYVLCITINMITL